MMNVQAVVQNNTNLTATLRGAGEQPQSEGPLSAGASATFTLEGTSTSNHTDAKIGGYAASPNDQPVTGTIDVTLTNNGTEPVRARQKSPTSGHDSPRTIEPGASETFSSYSMNPKGTRQEINLEVTSELSGGF